MVKCESPGCSREAQVKRDNGVNVCLKCAWLYG
jgi:hypothetical protein